MPIEKITIVKKNKVFTNPDDFLKYLDKQEEGAGK